MEHVSLRTFQSAKLHFERFKDGQEQGFVYFYDRYFKRFSYYAFRYVKDTSIADTITQEAYLRLWIMRDTISSVEALLKFLNQQLKLACKAYFGKTFYRFHRSMLQLDSIEDYQTFMLGYELKDDEDMDETYLDQLDEEKKVQTAQLEALLPNLSQQQQLIIRLCIKHAYNYERIATHLGGISDYEVGLQLEKCIATLKAALSNSTLLEQAQCKVPVVTDGVFTPEQGEILNMRYTLRYSFAQIAAALQLDDRDVRLLFIKAHAQLKQAPKTA